MSLLNHMKTFSFKTFHLIVSGSSVSFSMANFPAGGFNVKQLKSTCFSVKIHEMK